MSEDHSAEGQPEVDVSAAAVSGGGYTLFVADFADTSTAWEAYEALDSWDRLPALTHETLVLVGAEDALTDPENGRRMAERLPSPCAPSSTMTAYACVS